MGGVEFVFSGDKVSIWDDDLILEQNGFSPHSPG